MKCYACNKPGHLVNSCNLLHFIPDNEKILKKYEYSHMQERNPFERKKKKTRHKIFNQNNNLLFVANLPKPRENDSSEEYQDEDSEMDFCDSKDSSFELPKKNSKISFEVHAEKKNQKM